MFLNSHTKEQDQTIKQILVDFLNLSNFDSDVSIKKTSHCRFSNKNLSNIYKYEPSKTLKVSQKQSLMKFNDLKKNFILSNTIEQANKIEVVKAIDDFNFRIGYREGDKILPIHGVEFIIFDEIGAHIIHDSILEVQMGIVTLIDFWVINEMQNLHDQCYSPMANLEKMLKANDKKWRGKATIVGISLDDDSDELIKVIQEKDLRKVYHYRVKGGWDDQNKNIQMFSIDCLPFIVLLDQQGQIIYSGHPSGCNIENEINNLIDQDSQVKKQQVPENIIKINDQEQKKIIEQDLISKEQYSQIKKFLKNEWRLYTTTINEIDGCFNLSLEKQYEFSKDGQKKNRIYKKLQVDYRMEVKQKEWTLNGINLIQNSLDQNTISYLNQVINDPLSDRINHIKFFKQLIENYDLPITLVQNETKTLLYSQDQFKITVQAEYQQSEQFPPSMIDTIAKVNEQIKEYYQKNIKRNLNGFEKLLNQGFTYQIKLQEPCNNETQDDLIQMDKETTPLQEPDLLNENQMLLLEEFLMDQDHFNKLANMLKLRKLHLSFMLKIIKKSILDLETLYFQYLNIDLISLVIQISEKNLSIIQGTLDKIYSIIPKEHLSVKIEIIKTVDIPFPGDKCQLCSKTLNDQTPQYYSPFSQEFYCVECTDYENKEEIGLARYKVNDSVVFINAPLKDFSVLKDIDEYKLGKNLKIKEGEAGSQTHQFGCDGCGGVGKPGPRYIALSCRKNPLIDDGYVDFCSECFKIWSQKTTYEAKKIIKKNQTEQLSEDTIWLRVLFCHTYYVY